jgi:hypothetical protein
MSGNQVAEIERAIGQLTQDELDELRLWPEEYGGPSPLDRRFEADLRGGRLDEMVQGAIEDERNGRSRPL